MGADILVVNLVQQVCPTDPSNNRFQFRSRKAIRNCVSEEVIQALRETGLTQVPLITIPNVLDLEALPTCEGVTWDVSTC